MKKINIDVGSRWVRREDGITQVEVTLVQNGWVYYASEENSAYGWEMPERDFPLNYRRVKE